MSNENTNTPEKVGYTINDGGDIKQVLRNGVVVASYTVATKVVAVDADAASYRPVILRFLKKEGYEVGSSEVEGQPSQAAPVVKESLTVEPIVSDPSPVTPPPPVSQDEQVAAETPVQATAPVTSEEVVTESDAYKAGTYAPHKHPKYPDGPDLDPHFGEKTPAFVEWLANRK